MRSSPVEGDLEVYLDWLNTQLSNRESEALERARNILLDKYYGTEDVQQWKDCDERWERMGIPPGIGRKIATYVSRWRRQQQQEQGPRRPHSPGKIVRSIETQDTQDDTYKSYRGEVDLDDLEDEEDSQVLCSQPFE
jgi:hypothetical protein